MEFEGKYKIIYIGTAVLAILLFVLYGVYFIQQSQIKETTQNYNSEVRSANEKDLGVVLGTSAVELSEVVEEGAIIEEEPPLEEKEDEKEEEQVEEIVPVKKNSKKKRVANNPSQTPVPVEEVSEPVINNEEEILND